MEKMQQETTAAPHRAFTSLAPLVSFHVNPREQTLEAVVTDQHGSLCLSFSSNGPTFTIKDPGRGAMKCKAVFELSANGGLRGFVVKKIGAPGEPDQLEFFPTAKRQARKQNSVTTKTASKRRAA